MNPEQGQDHDEELRDEVPRGSRSLIPGRSRILIVFGVLAVVAVGALAYFRDGGPGSTRATEPVRASSTVGSAPASKDAPIGERRVASPTAETSQDATKSPAASMTASTAPLAGAPVTAAEGPKLAAEPKATTTEKKSAAEKPTAAEKSSTAEKSATKDAPKSAAPAKADSAATKSESAKAAPAKREAVSKPAPAAEARAGETSAKPYWVQVGAFKDLETANRVATQLRDLKLRVELSELRPAGGASPAPAPAPVEPPKPGSDRYEVVVSGSSPEDVNTKLTTKGLASQPAPDGAVITPSLPLGEAIALSKDLSGDNLKVRVRRVGGPQAAATPPREIAEKTTRSGETLHRVRVGGFPDRTAAVTALRDLETKGYKPFLVRE